jgi:hypothetical protein
MSRPWQLSLVVATSLRSASSNSNRSGSRSAGTGQKNKTSPHTLVPQLTGPAHRTHVGFGPRNAAPALQAAESAVGLSAPARLHWFSDSSPCSW